MYRKLRLACVRERFCDFPKKFFLLYVQQQASSPAGLSTLVEESANQRDGRLANPEAMLTFSVWYSTQRLERIQSMPAFGAKSFETAIKHAAG